jgi:twitching motility protein PilT
VLRWHRKAERIREQIAETNLALVLAMAKRTRMSEVDFADLVSEGNMALLRAVDKFDAGRGFKFSTYACRAILKAFSRQGMKLSKYRQRFPTDFDPKLEKSNFLETKRADFEKDAADEVRGSSPNRADLTDVERTVIEHRFGLESGEEKPEKPMTLEQVEGQIIGVTKERVRQIQNKAMEKIRDFDDDTRFRVNLFMARGKISVAARRITSNILPFEGLHLPPAMAKIAMQPQGIVLLCGVTGSGKSTTIASMLQYVNERKPVHIVTIEDPIEYIFNDAVATINQREIGIDCLDFKIALRALVRENPDIVLVGEMRDNETFEAALMAAETGHLVYGTIHASSTTQTFSRIYGLFEQEDVEGVRKILAYQMRAFVYQKLLPTLHEDIHRIPAIEILINNTVVQKHILEGREGELREYLNTVEAMQTGMKDFNQSLVELVEKEYIHMRTAIEASPNVDELNMRLKKLG